MPIVSVETARLLAKIAFLVGAATDALAVIPMLSPRIGTALFGGDPSRNGPGYRFAMGIAASLLAGWTCLLLWGAADPLERRDILLLTIFPVVSGIALASVVAARRGVVIARRMVPLWVHLGVVSSFYALVYTLSIPFAS
jgi:hypothetical protein